MQKIAAMFLGLFALVASSSAAGVHKVGSDLGTAVHVDIDDGGNVYEPILCNNDVMCGCPLGGRSSCGRCPNDNGSSNVNNNVCICYDAFGPGSGYDECNPRKVGGPFKVDVDSGNNRYYPMPCDPNNFQGRCNCNSGSTQCSRCPFDNGSQWKDYNVCWCATGGNPWGECNPDKVNGPIRN